MKHLTKTENLKSSKIFLYKLNHKSHINARLIYFIKNLSYFLKNTPKGIRIPVTSVKGKCPRPLDDGGIKFKNISFTV